MRWDSKWASALEAIASTAIGFILNIGMNYLVFHLYFGEPLSLWTNIWLTALFTGTSLGRSYYVRRLFVRMRQYVP